MTNLAEVANIQARDLRVGDEIFNSLANYRNYGWITDHVVKTDDQVIAKGQDKHGVEFALNTRPGQSIRIIKR
jgi:hypothetical protein